MTNKVIPFNFESYAIRVQVDEGGCPWFNATDICAALELTNPWQAIKSHVDPEDIRKFEAPSSGGVQRQNYVNESGLYALILGSTKDAAKRFKRWVTSDVLPSIRQTGRYAANGAATDQPASASAVQPCLEFQSLFSVARLIGLDNNVSAISANQGVLKLTGTNVLQLLGQQHMTAEDQDAMFFTPTELGKRLGMTGRQFNQMLAEAGMQKKAGDSWDLLLPSAGLARILDTGKRHNSGTMVQQIKWSPKVLTLLDKADAA